MTATSAFPSDTSVHERRTVAQPDLYVILELERSATPEEIKQAYRRLAVRYHPDRNPDDRTSEEKFKALSEAYEVLRDPVRRTRYDRERFVGRRRAGAGGEGEDGVDSGLRDFFDEVLTRAGEKLRSRRGPDLRYHLELTLEEAAFGTKSTIRVPRRRPCSNCEGSGARPGSRPKKCPDCKGEGKIPLQAGLFSISKTCENCSGRGWLILEVCSQCRGKGSVEVHEAMEITVPAGVDNGTRLKQQRCGMPGVRGGEPGDLFVVVSVADHMTFSRVDNDLYSEVRISFPQAALGDRIEIPSIDGPVEIDIPSGVQSGTVITLEGKGVPSLPGGSRGDFLVTLTVETPEELTTEQQELLEKFSEAVKGGSRASDSLKNRMKDVF